MGENIFFQFQAESASEMLSKMLLQATPDDILGEYIWFLKNLPDLLNNQKSDLDCTTLITQTLITPDIDHTVCKIGHWPWVAFGLFDDTNYLYPISMSIFLLAAKRVLLQPDKPNNTLSENLCHVPLCRSFNIEINIWTLPIYASVLVNMGVNSWLGIRWPPYYSETFEVPFQRW